VVLRPRSRGRRRPVLSLNPLSFRASCRYSRRAMASLPNVSAFSYNRSVFRLDRWAFHERYGPTWAATATRMEPYRALTVGAGERAVLHEPAIFRRLPVRSPGAVSDAECGAAVTRLSSRSLRRSVGRGLSTYCGVIDRSSRRLADSRQQQHLRHGLSRIRPIFYDRRALLAGVRARVSQPGSCFCVQVRAVPPHRGT